MTFEQFQEALKDTMVVHEVYKTVCLDDHRIWIVVEARQNDNGEPELFYRTMNVVEVTKFEPAALGLQPGGWQWVGQQIIFRTTNG